MLGSRSAIEWVVERYRVKTDKASGIINHSNDWSTEVGDPRYILDLLKRIVTVSMETVRVVEDLPTLRWCPPSPKPSTWTLPTISRVLESGTEDPGAVAAPP